ncbi:MAG: FAD-dependent oxidoreductase [Acidobacteria bacterium]|nr:FAD-dependent oxidoreductase [Acidobacteriota bacterium]
MNLIKTLMGRRRFVMGAGVASTCALACNKLAAFETRAAIAAEETAVAALKAAGNRCPHLLSPLRIRNRVLKNRIMHTQSPIYFMQGPENFPTESYRNHYSNMAKNAAIVSMSSQFGKYPKTYEKIQDAFYHMANSIWEDIPPVENYICQLMEDIHCEGSLIYYSGDTGGGAMGPINRGGSGAQQGGAPGSQRGAGNWGGAPGGMPGGNRGGGMPGFASKTDDEILKDAKEAEAKGYDVFQMNTTSLEAAKKVRAATNLILMGSIRGSRGNMGLGSGENAVGLNNSNQPTAAELEEGIEQARKLEGIADFLWIRIDEHPNAWTQDKSRPRSLAYAEAIKKAGIRIITCPSAGFHDPVENDRFIAEGKTDMVGMTMPFFADPELVRKVAEGRPDDVVPCIGCHNCHGISVYTGPWYSTCTVNPKWGLPPYKLQSITKPTISKKVAVIGGGPAGMKAALVAVERGHKVILYEKDAALGGLLKISDNSQWRWNYKDLKEYFIHQVKKAGVDVRLNTTATPGIIKAGKYDAVLVAVGTDVVESKMKADGSKVFNILDVYYKKNELGKNVVVLGAGKYGIEAATGMLKDGHKVTVLTSGKELVEIENQGAHNMMNQQNIYQNHPNFSYVLEATVKSITGGKVVYTDSTGSEKTVQADGIVIWSGLKPRMDEAEKFIGSANSVLFVGDCTGTNGSIQKVMRSTFFVASQV